MCISVISVQGFRRDARLFVLSDTSAVQKQASQQSANSSAHSTHAANYLKIRPTSFLKITFACSETECYTISISHRATQPPPPARAPPPHLDGHVLSVPAAAPDVSVAALADALVQGHLARHGALDEQRQARAGAGRARLQQLLQVAAAAREAQLGRLQ